MVEYCWKKKLDCNIVCVDVCECVWMSVNIVSVELNGVP